jgi:hypothetical protein
MLTRREVEGELRSLYPMRRQARQVRRSRWKTRRRLRVTVAVLLGIGLIAALGLARVRATWAPPTATRQNAEWGANYVDDSPPRARRPLFPPSKRSRWDSYAARAHGAGRDPITGVLRYPRRTARN